MECFCFCVLWRVTHVCRISACDFAAFVCGKTSALILLMWTCLPFGSLSLFLSSSSGFFAILCGLDISVWPVTSKLLSFAPQSDSRFSVKLYLMLSIHLYLPCFLFSGTSVTTTFPPPHILLLFSLHFRTTLTNFPAHPWTFLTLSLSF